MRLVDSGRSVVQEIRRSELQAQLCCELARPFQLLILPFWLQFIKCEAEQTLSIRALTNGAYTSTRDDANI